jgi:hypothetical protein
MSFDELLLEVTTSWRFLYTVMDFISVFICDDFDGSFRALSTLHLIYACHVYLLRYCSYIDCCTVSLIPC